MKKLLAVCLVTFVLSGTKFYAQPWYGVQTYQSDSSILTSAKRTFNNIGYVMAAYRPNGQPNVIINKVNGAGNYSGVNNFYGRYSLKNCSNGGVGGCYGVSVIETSPTGHSQAYAAVATSSFGIHFMTITASGAITQQLNIALPGVPSIQKKPSIRESATPGHYYVCASYIHDSALVMKIDATPVTPMITWSKFYAARWMEPNDLIESPYNSNELIVVGRCDPDTIANANGFFLKLSSASGAVVGFTTYTKYTKFHGDEWFSSIEKANSTAGSSNGYVLGGRANYPTTWSPPCHCYITPNYSYTQWMVKMDPNGKLIWSTLIEPRNASTFTQNVVPGNEISRVYERKNSNKGTYEYYGVADEFELPSPTNTTSTRDTNIVVYKLDDSGSNSITPNEFHYKATFLQSTVYGNSQITGIETGGGSNDGIQMFVTGSRKSNLTFVKAYFNGVAGCTDLQVNIDKLHPGPDSTTIITPTVTNYLPCSGGVNLQQIPGVIGQTICAASSVSGGSNSKLASPVGLPIYTKNSSISVFPNPSQGSVFINFEQVSAASKIEIKIYDSVGKVAGEISLAPASTLEVNFQDFKLPAGIYFLNVQDGQNTSHIKIIYTPQ